MEGGGGKSLGVLFLHPVLFRRESAVSSTFQGYQAFAAVSDYCLSSLATSLSFPCIFFRCKERGTQK